MSDKPVSAPGSKPPSPRHRQILGLDALRFFASLLVVGFHLAFWNWTKAMNPLHEDHIPYRSLIPVTWVGWIGVEIFFVLSGFVITYSAQGSGAWLFLQHRLTRLFPAALICACVTLAVILLQTPHPSPPTLALMMGRSIFFLPRGPYLDDSYWTLSIEISFYAVVFTLLWLRRPRALTTVMACIGSISTAVWIADVCFYPRLGSFGQNVATHFAEGVWGSNVLLIRHGCYFTLGAFLWLCLFRPVRLKYLAVLALCIFGGALQIVSRTRYMDSQSGDNFAPVLPLALWLLALGFIVFSVRRNEALTHFAGRHGVVILRRLGLMTYPLYLLHQVVGMALLTRLRHHISDAAALTITILSVLLLAYLVSRFAEPTLQRAMKRIFKMLPERRATQQQPA